MDEHVEAVARRGGGFPTRPWSTFKFPTDRTYCYSLNAKGSASNPLHLLGISWIAFALFGIQTPESGNLPALSFWSLVIMESHRLNHRHGD